MRSMEKRREYVMKLAEIFPEAANEERHVFFNNKLDRPASDRQVAELVRKIDIQLQDRGVYTHELFQESNAQFQEQIMRQKQVEEQVGILNEQDQSRLLW